MESRSVKTKPVKIDESPRLESMLTGAIILHASSQLGSRSVVIEDGPVEQTLREFTYEDLSNQFDDINRELLREGFRPMLACFYPPNQGFDSPQNLGQFDYYKIGFFWSNNHLKLLTPGDHLRGRVEDTPGPMASDEFFDTLLNYAQIYGRRFEQKRVFIEYFNKIGWLDVDYTDKRNNIFKVVWDGSRDGPLNKKSTSGWETATGDEVYTPNVSVGTTFELTIGNEDGYNKKFSYIRLTPEVRPYFPGFLVDFTLTDEINNRYEGVHVAAGQLGVAKIGSDAGKLLINGLKPFYDTHPGDIVDSGACLDFEVMKVPDGQEQRYEYKITAIGRTSQ